jgi:1-acyl-sn-glycerol-3-phosphate acyltransferase
MLQGFSRWFWYGLGYWSSGLILLLGHSMRIFGHHRVPKTGPLLVIANHESFYDPILAGMGMGRKVAFMARKTLYKSRALARFMERVGTFAVDQEGTGLDGIKTALKKLQAGEIVVVFPEGTRTPDGKMQPFLPGVALLVRRAKVPVVPVGIGGAYDAWPIHAKKPRWGPLWGLPKKEAIAVVIGQPIPPEVLVPMEPKKMLAYLTERVAELRERAYEKKRLPTTPA